MLLADLGATVIKVEHPDEPDYARSFPPFVGEEGEELSAFFSQFNRNKLGNQALVLVLEDLISDPPCHGGDGGFELLDVNVDLISEHFHGHFLLR